MLYGRGTTDMKGGVAVGLKLATELTAQDTDYNLTYIFYDNEGSPASSPAWRV